MEVLIDCVALRVLVLDPSRTVVADTMLFIVSKLRFLYCFILLLWYSFLIFWGFVTSTQAVLKRGIPVLLC